MPSIIRHCTYVKYSIVPTPDYERPDQTSKAASKELDYLSTGTPPKYEELDIIHPAQSQKDGTGPGISK